MSSINFRSSVRHTIYGFSPQGRAVLTAHVGDDWYPPLPYVTLAPGEKRTLEATVRGHFKPHRLIMSAIMNETRGRFRLKRLPRAKQFLNRDNVIAYSVLARGKKKSWRRTVIEYRDQPTGNFVRSYLPSSVEYIHEDALHYVRLHQLYVGTIPQMPIKGPGCSAALFSQNAMGVSTPMDAAQSGVSITMVIDNQGDTPIQVTAAIAGVER